MAGFGDFFDIPALFKTTSELLFGDGDNGSGLVGRVGAVGFEALQMQSESPTPKTKVPDLSGSNVSIHAKQTEAPGPKPLQSVDAREIRDKWTRLMRKHNEDYNVVASSLVQRRN